MLIACVTTCNINEFILSNLLVTPAVKQSTFFHRIVTFVRFFAVYCFALFLSFRSENQSMIMFLPYW